MPSVSKLRPSLESSKATLTEAWPTFVTMPVPTCESALQPPDSYKPTMSPVARRIEISHTHTHTRHVRTLKVLMQVFHLTGSEAVAGQSGEPQVLPRLKDDNCSAVQASGLTSYVQLQQANSFVLEVFQRDVLLPNPTRTEEDNAIKRRSYKI